MGGSHPPSPCDGPGEHVLFSTPTCITQLVKRAIRTIKNRAKARRHAANDPPSVAKERSARWYKKNKPTAVARTIKYNKENPDKYRAANAKYARRRLATDAVFRLQKNLRTRLRAAIVKVGAQKRHTTMQLVGCDGIHLVAHLTAQLSSGETLLSKDMDVDHIFPMSRYDMTRVDEQRRCMHWSNLRPLLKKKNQMKHAKLPPRSVAMRVNRECWPVGVDESDLSD